MEEKIIADWEAEFRHPTIDLSLVRPNQIEVDSIEVGYKPIGKVDNQQSREPTEE